MAFDYKKNRVWAENLTLVMQLGLTMAGCIVLCFFAGRYVDQWLGTRGIFITLFTVFGVVGGANVAYRQIIEITTPENDVKKDTNPPKNGSN
jgi:lipid-A-disaccharide synthase-like uncharacterized protein